MVDQITPISRQKRVAINARVSGCFGDLFDPGTGNKRRHRRRLNGTVLSAEGPRQYKVQFDDGATRIVYSNLLKVESSLESLPPNIRPANEAPPQEANNDTDSEHLPPEVESDDDEEDREIESDEEGEATGGDETQLWNLPVRSLPTTHEATVIGYHQAKMNAHQKIQPKLGLPLLKIINPSVRQLSGLLLLVILHLIL